jgi:hypothetical protein
MPSELIAETQQLASIAYTRNKGINKHTVSDIKYHPNLLHKFAISFTNLPSTITIPIDANHSV